MAGESDDTKGRVKEAGGKLTGDKDMQREGKVDRASGKVKDATQGIADKAKGAIRK